MHHRQTIQPAQLARVCPRLMRGVVERFPLDERLPSAASVLVLSGHTEDHFSIPYALDPLTLTSALKTLYRDRVEVIASYSMVDGLSVEEREHTSARTSGGVSGGASNGASSGTSDRTLGGAIHQSEGAQSLLNIAREAQREAQRELSATGRLQHEPHQAIMELDQLLRDRPRTLCVIRGVGDWEAISSERPDVISALKSWPDLCMSQGSLVIFAAHQPSQRLCQFFQGMPYCHIAALSGPCERELEHWLVTQELHRSLSLDPTLSREVVNQLKRQSHAPHIGLKATQQMARVTLDEAWLELNGARAFHPQRVDISGLAQWFDTSIIGQARAKSAVLASAKSLKYFGTEHRRQPLIRALFTGPPGVGKTEIARGLSAFLYGQDEPLLISCTEYQQEHEVAKLLGAPPGYVGYGEPSVIERFISERGAGVIIFDEFEKAHKRVHQALMGALEEGTLHTPSGAVIALDQSVIIGTTNAGHQEVLSALSATPDLSAEQVAALYERGVERRFDGPLLRRFDIKVTFDLLTTPELSRVAELYLTRALKRFCPEDLEVSWSPEFVDALVCASDPTLGAGELKNVVEASLKSNLIERYHELEIKPLSLSLSL